MQERLYDVGLGKPSKQRRCGAAIRDLPAGQHEGERAAEGARQLEVVSIYRRFLSEVVKHAPLVTPTPLWVRALITRSSNEKGE